MKTIKTKIEKFYKDHEEVIDKTAKIAGVCIGTIIVVDYIKTKRNIDGLKTIANKTVDYGTKLCDAQRNEINEMIDKGLGESDECLDKTVEMVHNYGGLLMAKQVKKTVDKL